MSWGSYHSIPFLGCIRRQPLESYFPCWPYLALANWIIHFKQRFTAKELLAASENQLYLPQMEIRHQGIETKCVTRALKRSLKGEFLRHHYDSNVSGHVSVNVMLLSLGFIAVWMSWCALVPCPDFTLSVLFLSSPFFSISSALSIWLLTEAGISVSCPSSP